MSSHIFTLFDGVPGGGSVFLTGPAFYGSGLTYKYPLLARVSRAALGYSSIVKIQGAALPVNTCAFAARGPGSEQGELQVVALSGDFYQVQLAQRIGVALSTTHLFAGNLLTISMGTDGAGNSLGSVQHVGEYINANISADFLATWSGSNAGRLGATFLFRPCPRAHWTDVVSTIGGLLPAAVEQTLDPGAGLTADYGIEINVRNYCAVRAAVKSTDADPAEGDLVRIYVTEEGA